MISKVLCGIAVGAVVSLMGSTVRAGEGTTPFKGRVGIQLYSLRDQFKSDVPGTLDMVKRFGVRYVELAGTYGLEPAAFKKELATRGIQAVSGHFPYERFRDDVEGIATEAKALGLMYAGCAWIPHEGDFDEKEARAAVDVFNRAGAALAKHGLKFFYHTHGYEFQPYGGETLFDLLVKETNPKAVSFEMDVFWIVHPGQDPAKLLAKYGSRFELMHVKDMRKGTPTGLLTGSSDVTNDMAVGEGIMNWPSILRAADKAGVKWYFIEDESPSVVEQLPRSLKYLSGAKY